MFYGKHSQYKNILPLELPDHNMPELTVRLSCQKQHCEQQGYNLPSMDAIQPRVHQKLKILIHLLMKYHVPADSMDSYVENKPVLSTMISIRLFFRFQHGTGLFHM